MQGSQKRRTFKPKPANHAHPVSFSDDDSSAFVVTGLTGRRVRELGDRLGIPFAPDGRRRIYLVATWEAHIAEASQRPGGGEPKVVRLDADATDTPDGVLAALGLRRTA